MVRLIKSRFGPSRIRYRVGFITFDIIFGINLILFGHTVVKANTTDAQQMLNQNAATMMNNELATQTNTIMPVAASTASITHSGVSGTASWDIDSTGKLTIHAGQLAYGPGNWKAYASSITSVYVEEGVSPYTTYLTTGGNNGVFSNLANVVTIDVTNMDVSATMTLGSMFENDPKLTEIIGLDTWNTGKAISMSNMFNKDSSLKNLDLSHFDTSSLQSLSMAFSECKSLESLDVTGWNTSSVTSLYYLFNGVSGEIKGLDTWNTSKVNSMYYAFEGNDFTKMDPDQLKNWDVSNVTDMTGLFKNTKFTSLDLSKWNMSNVTDMSSMLAGDSNVDQVKNISEWDMSKVINMGGMFSGVTDSQLSFVNNWDVSSVTSMANMFANCSNLTSLDLSKWDTKNVKYVNSMFSGDKLLNEDTLDGYKTLVTSNVTNISYLFNGTGFRVLDLSKYDTSNVTDFNYLFSNTNKLEKIIGTFDTANAISMANMFASSTATDFSELNVKDWNTSKVQTFSNIFQGTKIDDFSFLKDWDTSSVTNFSYAFSKNNVVKEIPVDNWNLSNAKFISSMFAEDIALEKLSINNCDVSNVTDMSGLFMRDSSMRSIDISNWNTSNVKTFATVFYQMTNLTTLDLSTLDMTNATSVAAMISYDTALWKLKLGPKSALLNFQGEPNKSSSMNGTVHSAGSLIQDPSTDTQYKAISDKWQAVDEAAGGTDHKPLGDLISNDDLIKKFSVAGNPVTTYVWQQQPKIKVVMTVPNIEFGTVNNAGQLVQRKEKDLAIDFENKNDPAEGIQSDLTVQMSHPLTSDNGSNTLNDVLIYREDGQDDQVLTNSPTAVFSGNLSVGNSSLKWDEDHGILLDMSHDQYAQSGHYSTTLTWSLTNSI